jgi:hypothetical protein
VSIIGGDQVPVIPSMELFGSGDAGLYWHIAATLLNVGLINGASVIVIDAVEVHPLVDVTVTVYVLDTVTDAAALLPKLPDQL